MRQMTHRMTVDLSRLARDSHDVCSVCGKSFSEGETAHAGYDKEGAALYVGDCCANRLLETAVRYYWMQRAYEVPAPSTVLWRYVSLAKLLSLLETRSLHFARADRLGDPFEGAKGLLKKKEHWDAHYLAFFESALRNPPPGVDFKLSDEEVASEANRLLCEMADGGNHALTRTFLSCWHEGEHESEALWRVYGGDTGQAVAIRTTYSKLQDALGDDPSISIGRVKYLDFATAYAGVNECFFRKRVAFRHECEVRALINLYENPAQEGVTRLVDINTLIAAIRVSPLAPAWFQSIVTGVVRRYGLGVEVEPSTLADEPFY